MSNAVMIDKPSATGALEATYTAAVTHYQAQENVAALAELERLAALAPAGSFHLDHYYYFKINILGFRYHDHAGVLALCEEATRNCPRYAPTWFLKGRVLWELGRTGPALQAFIRAVRLDPTHGPATYELTKILHLRGRQRMARVIAERARANGVKELLIGDILDGRAGARKPPPRTEQRWRLPAAVPRRCEGVFLVVGSSYCGSTLLNVMLGAHPRIAGGGELHWLIREPLAERLKEGLCVFCGDDCAVWTPSRRADADAANVYDLAALAFDKPYVCDTSKMPDWSNFIAPFTPAPRVRILMVKHPLRHVASYVEKARRTRRPGGHADIDTILDDLTKLYALARREPVDFVLRYEDLVADPRSVLTPILARFGLDYDPAIDDWRSAPHHDVGGNAGPRSQIAPTLRPYGGFLQRKYNRGDVFIDDSFAAVLSADEIETVLSHPLAQAMCREFGYEPRIVPGEDALRRPMDARSAEASLRLQPAALIGPFESNGGHRYLARLELLAQHAAFPRFADKEQTPKRSRLWLLEDGRPLGPAHVNHQDIADLGAGRFSHWEDVLYFSASDNTDPNSNGRIYEVTLRRPWNWFGLRANRKHAARRVIAGEKNG